MHLYYYLVFLIIAERILELGLSRIHQKRLKNRGYAQREPSADYKAMVAVHTFWILGLLLEPYIIIYSVSTHLHTALASLAIFLFMLGQALRLWTLVTLGESWNTQVMTPKAEQSAAAKIVSGGPYRFIRHPNYLAVILEFISLPLLGQAYLSGVIALSLNLIILKRRISTEESWLMQLPEYRSKMATKPCLWPKLSTK